MARTNGKGKHANDGSQCNLHKSIPERTKKKKTRNQKRKPRSEPRENQQRLKRKKCSEYNLRRSNSVILVSEVPCCASEEDRKKYSRLGLNSALFFSNNQPAKRKQSHISVITISSDDEDTSKQPLFKPLESSTPQEAQNFKPETYVSENISLTSHTSFLTNPSADFTPIKINKGHHTLMPNDNCDSENQDNSTVTSPQIFYFGTPQFKRDIIMNLGNSSNEHTPVGSNSVSQTLSEFKFSGINRLSSQHSTTIFSNQNLLQIISTSQTPEFTHIFEEESDEES